MFNPKATFHVDGEALGLTIGVDISIAGSNADATSLVADGANVLVVDVVNVQAVLVSAVTTALIKLQAMHEGLGGASVQDIRGGRQKPPTEVAAEVVVLSPDSGKVH